MAYAAVDTLYYSKQRQEEGLATKADLKELGLKMESGVRELELRMTIKFGAMMVTGVAILATLIKFGH